MLQRADARARRAAERTLMIGDTTHDLQLAANAGCASVAVSFGAHSHAEFAAFAPLHVAALDGRARDMVGRQRVKGSNEP